MKKLTAKEEEIMNILWAEGPLLPYCNAGILSGA